MPDHTISPTKWPPVVAPIPRKAYLPILKEGAGAFLLVPKRMGCGQYQVFRHESPAAEPRFFVLNLSNIALQTVKVVRHFDPG
jgi:hypothetical protein